MVCVSRASELRCPEAAHFRDRRCRVYGHLPSGPVVVKPLACLPSARIKRSRLPPTLQQVAWGLEMAELARGIGMLGRLPWSFRARLSFFSSWAFGKLKVQAESQLRSSKSRRGCESSQGRPLH